MTPGEGTPLLLGGSLFTPGEPLAAQLWEALMSRGHKDGLLMLRKLLKVRSTSTFSSLVPPPATFLGPAFCCWLSQPPLGVNGVFGSQEALRNEKLKASVKSKAGAVSAGIRRASESKETSTSERDSCS